MIFSKKTKDKSAFLREVAPYLNLGWQLATTILVMVAVGWLLDKWLGTQPVFLIIFSFLGCAVALFDFIRSALKRR
jgi:F0F1-type ATP synthase assembly protein I